MKKIGRKMLLAAISAVCCLLPSQSFAVDVQTSSSEGTNYTSAEDWTNEAGATVVKGGGDETETDNVSNNEVSVNSGSFTGIFGAMTSTGHAKYNTVNFNGGTVSGGIVGGFTFYNNSLTAGNVADNTVNFNNGTAAWVSGGEVGYTGSISDYSQLTGGNVYGNTVNIYGGTVTGGVIGGSALTGSAYNNKINISGGKISGVVIGGEVRKPQSGSTASDNTITIEGNPDLSSATLYGGVLGTSNYEAAGNVLQINTSGITIGSINSDSFEKIEFNLPQSVVAGSDVLYTNSSSLSLDKIGVTLHGQSPLQKGDTFNLVVNNVSADLLTSADSLPETVGAAKGALLTGTVNLTSSSDGILATVGDFSANETNYEEVAKTSDGNFVKVIIPELDPFTQSMVDTELDRGVGTEGTGESTEETVSDDPTLVPDVRALNGYNIFINSGGGKIKSKTGGGTYVKSSRGNYDLGIARTFEGQAGRLYLAPVFERATGRYDAVLPKNVLGEDMRGHGSTKYTAGGIIARYLNQSGVYYEASIRGGKSENSFASNDFIIENVRTRVSYDMEAPVWTGHLRIGDAIRLSPKSLLDVYGTYFYTRQSGMGTNLSTGEHVNFNSVTGHSIRIGYRLTTRTSKVSKVYGGLAYQYDRNSDSTVSAFGYSKKSRGARGSSGMIELGWQIKPNKDVPWVVDINATGWMGRMQGFNVMAKIQKSF